MDLCIVFNFPCFLLPVSKRKAEEKENFHQAPRHPISWDCPHKKEIIINLDIYLHAHTDRKGFFVCCFSPFLGDSASRLKTGIAGDL